MQRHRLLKSVGRYFPVIVLLFAASSGHISAQEVIVRDRSTLMPVGEVSVINIRTMTSVLTDVHGVATLPDAKMQDTIAIQRLGYYPRKIAWAEIYAAQGIVLLTENLLKLGEIVVTPNKWEEDLREIPFKVITMTPREIAFANPQTTADLLTETGEVFVQKSQMGGGSAILRGFEANKVLMIVDGVRMNNAIYRSGHLQNVIMLDPSSLDNAEVIFGPGSVMYGSDALGGVMDFHTREPHFGKDGLLLFGGAYGRYATANQEKTGHLNLNLGWERFASVTAVTFSDFDDLRSGNIHDPFHGNWGRRPEYAERINGRDSVVQNDNPNVQKFTGYHQLNLLQKLVWQPAAGMKLQYGFIYSTTSDIPRYDRLTTYSGGTLSFAEWYYGPQNWMMHSLRLNLSAGNMLFDNARFTAAYQTVEEDRITRRFNRTAKTHQEENVAILSFNADFEKDLADEHRLFYGLEAVHNDVLSEAYEENILTGAQVPAATRYPDGDNTIFSGAAYLSWKWKASEWLDVSAGARFSVYDLKSTLKDTSFSAFPYSEITNSSSAVNGSVGFVFHPTEEWQINTSVTSGYRAPNLDDIAKIFESTPGFVRVPNPNLKPEYVYSAELGVIGWLGESVRIQASGFYSIMRDAIVTRDFQFNGQDSIIYDGATSKVQANINAGKARIRGLSVSLRADLTPDVSLSGSCAYTEGRDESNDVPLDHVPPVFGRVGIMYRRDRFMGEFYTIFNGWKKLQDYSPSGEDNLQYATPFGAPGWMTLNVKTSYQITPYLQLNLGLENILDDHYRPFASNVSAAGRNLIVALRATMQ